MRLPGFRSAAALLPVLRVLLGRLALALGVCLGLAGAPAQAVCTQGACVTAGSRLASVDSTRGPMLNAVLGSLLGTSLNLTVADWNALATSNINLASLINALQVQTSTATPAAALGASTTVAGLINAAANAASADGNTAAYNALNLLRGQIPALTGNVVLGDILKLTLPNGMLAQGTINALDLVTGVVQLFNYRNVLTTPAPITAGLPLVSGLASVTAYAQVIEPPVIVCGPTGTTFHTAAIRVKLDLGLVSNPIALNVAGLVAVSLKLVKLGLYVEVARADGSIQSINALANALVMRATPGVADLYLGQIADNVFFNRTRSLSSADVAYADIGTVDLTLIVPLTLAVQARSSARGQAPFATDLSFAPPWPQTRTASSSAGFLSTMLNSLLTTNLEVRVVDPTNLLGGLLSGLLNAIKPVLNTVLGPLLNSVLTSLVDPLLQLLGVRIGEVDVTVSGASAFCGLAGYAYNDANHNATREGMEAGCGTPLWAKLVPAATPAGPAIAAVSVDATSGQYAFANLTNGTYNVLLDTNATLSDVTPGWPAGWLATETPTGLRAVTMASADVGGQNFGLFNGSQLSGSVFKDNGQGSGSANNVVMDGTEAGLVGVTVRVTDNAGTTTHASTVTGTAGAYTLWIPAAAGTGPLRVVETNLPDYLSIGASVGTTGGTYARATDSVSFTHASGTRYTGVNFADVPDSALINDNVRAVQPGAVAFHPHVFTAGTAGQLTLTLTNVAAPPNVPWGSALYLDTNCNGFPDTGEPVVTAPIAAVADQKLCFVVRVQAPPNAPFDADFTQTLSGSFTYANSALAWSGARTDLTTTGRLTDSGLLLTKSVDKDKALPGETLTYTIRYENRSSGQLGNLNIHDVTPAYTVYLSAACGPQPTGITACAVAQQPSAGATGALRWALTGTLTPGASGTVNFSVTVQ
ncbi:MAG: hypothetical protein REI09_08635 [Candidatus Dactylopiibacterium sp.]|nr:hypothetical protein [Candidatus Dactylopiibacterium sp.]